MRSIFFASFVATAAKLSGGAVYAWTPVEVVETAHRLTSSDGRGSMLPTRFDCARRSTM